MDLSWSSMKFSFLYMHCSCWIKLLFVTCYYTGPTHIRYYFFLVYRCKKFSEISLSFTIITWKLIISITYKKKLKSISYLYAQWEEIKFCFIVQDISSLQLQHLVFFLCSVYDQIQLYPIYCQFLSWGADSDTQWLQSKWLLGKFTFVLIMM